MVSFSTIGQNNNYVPLLFSKLHFKTYSDFCISPLLVSFKTCTFVPEEIWEKQACDSTRSENSQKKGVGHMASLHKAN